MAEEATSSKAAATASADQQLPTTTQLQCIINARDAAGAILHSDLKAVLEALPLDNMLAGANMLREQQLEIERLQGLIKERSNLSLEIKNEVVAQNSKLKEVTRDLSKSSKQATEQQGLLRTASSSLFKVNDDMAKKQAKLQECEWQLHRLQGEVDTLRDERRAEEEKRDNLS
jgi:chromosome segregation ATPase